MLTAQNITALKLGDIFFFLASRMRIEAVSD